MQNHKIIIHRSHDQKIEKEVIDIVKDKIDQIYQVIVLYVDTLPKDAKVELSIIWAPKNLEKGIEVNLRID